MASRGINALGIKACYNFVLTLDCVFGVAVGGRSPRFDPTAYQREREMRKRETEQKL